MYSQTSIRMSRIISASVQFTKKGKIFIFHSLIGRYFDAADKILFHNLP